jgi:hypothetical protein
MLTTRTHQPCHTRNCFGGATGRKEAVQIALVAALCTPGPMWSLIMTRTRAWT